jgi:hypothetical protein
LEFGLFKLGFLNWAFEIGTKWLFMLIRLSVEFNLGFLVFGLFIVVCRFEFGLFNLAFKVGLFTFYGLLVEINLGFFCIWTFYYSLAF